MNKSLSVDDMPGDRQDYPAVSEIDQSIDMNLLNGRSSHLGNVSNNISGVNITTMQQEMDDISSRRANTL